VRLDVGPLTEEDSMIFILGTRQTWKPAAAMLLYMRADRRDADLMYEAQQQRAGGHWGWIRGPLDGPWFGGPLRSSQAINPAASNTVAALPPERYT
jgi:hypothetical protein